MARRGRVCVLVAALALPALAAFPVRGAEGASREWLRGVVQSLEICVRGEVFEADGTLAAAVKVSGGLNTQTGPRPLEAVVRGNRFEAWIAVNRLQLYSLWLKAEAEDGSRLAIYKLNAFDLRQAASEGLRLTLEAPTRQVEVQVLAEGKPAAGATVQAETGFGVTMRTTTDDDGIARLGLLANQTLTDLMAWTDDKVGGFSFSRKPTRDPAANEHVIELSACRDQTLRFVDEAGAPIAGLDFVSHIATPAPDFNFIGVNEHSRATTDAAGEAVLHWFPDWEQHHFYVDLESAGWIADDEPEIVDGAYVFQLIKRAQARRRVRMALRGAEVAGLYVQFESFQGERESNTDLLWAWTDEGGRYSVDVLPDATYCAHVQDETWVSPMVDFVAYDSTSGQTASPELVVSEGQEVEVLVTSGAEKRAYPHLSVAFFREHSYTWLEDGDTHNGTGSAQWWATTDASGRAVTRTLPGPLKVKIYTPLWSTEESLEVVAGKPATVRLHCGVDEKQRVTGRLAFAADVAADLAGAEITWGAVDGKFDEQGTLACDADGAFAFESAATEVGVFAATGDGRMAGAAVTKDLTAPMEVRLAPTVDYEGQLLGAGDEPLAGHAVRAIVRVEGEEDFDSLFAKSFEAARIEATTDAEGNFTLTPMPSGVKAYLQADSIDGSDSTEHLGELFLEPGKARPRRVHRLEPKD